MLKIYIGFAVIFMLIYLAYKAITRLDDKDLEFLITKIPIVAACALITALVVGFIVVNF